MYIQFVCVMCVCDRERETERERGREGGTIRRLDFMSVSFAKEPCTNVFKFAPVCAHTIRRSGLYVGLFWKRALCIYMCVRERERERESKDV